MNLKEIKVDAFEGLLSLKYLALSRNRLECFEKGTLYCLVNLKFLGVDNNLLESLRPGLFRRLNRLESLNLSDNPLSADMDEDTFLGLTNLKEINLDETPLGQAIDRLSSIIKKHLINLKRLSQDRLDDQIFCG
jgi:Leucine-rich repeat (LRR) protein